MIRRWADFTGPVLHGDGEQPVAFPQLNDVVRIPLFRYLAPQQAGEAPLYCISPGNGLPVTGWHKGDYAPNEKPAQQAPTKECLTSYEPAKRSSFLKRLSFQASIGQAF